MKLKVIIHSEDDGSYWAEVPSIPGCSTQGDTMEELIQNLHEAIEGCLAVDIEPQDYPDNISIMELAI